MHASWRQPWPADIDDQPVAVGALLRIGCLLTAPLLALGAVARDARTDLAIGQSARVTYVEQIAGPLHDLLAADAAASVTIGAAGGLRTERSVSALRAAQDTIDRQHHILSRGTIDVPRDLRDVHETLVASAAALAERYRLLIAVAARSVESKPALAHAAAAHRTHIAQLNAFRDAAIDARLPLPFRT